MEQSKQQQIRELTDRLNRCRYEYYNLNAPSLTDAEYDALFDELSTLEKETGFSMTNSPTQTVGCYTDVIRIRATKIESFRKKYACTQRKSRRPRCGSRLSASEQLGYFAKKYV